MTKVGRGPYKVGLAKRAEILDAALQEFSVVGFEAASLRSIATRVGITHAGLQHHFASKDDLLLGVLLAQEEADRQFFDADAPLDVDDLIDAYTRVAERRRSTPAWVRLWISLKLSVAAQPEHIAADHVRRRVEAWEQELVDLFDRAQREGVIAADLDCIDAARGLLALNEGLMIRQMLDPSIDVDGPLRWAFAQLHPRDRR
ncbi:TetR/AcrR family transcriptional regulator [Aeromicrobium senzhongii]|uniref:TetR/AcrR family transcriptional regulator n=1 Tax=Aeromicrobium senzhongii TaxID=2663859 RepID=A0A8I0JZV7_9ACTN|nr:MULTISPECIES: TetR/AcrR family transcriptional regulator [Aeromicrobium]MBC9225128.1 TetR/AcrR family transcriptional regulator [Aeromicrobium senzhongii]QNL95759.1 TetR/AcrR family transcriptional regulator [Aeromicrobium senzhongii]